MRKIELTQGKYALVDDEDFEWLSQWKWFACKYGVQYYALRGHPSNNGRRMHYMHREILNLKPNDDKLSDHINHNGLDNRRYNLRVVTRRENNQNRRSFKGGSKYRGVSRCTKGNKWRARISSYEKEYFIGHFINEIEAARAYDTKAEEIFGEFAVLNFKESI